MRCNSCDTIKSINDFANEKRNVANHGKRYSCRDCERAYYRKRREKMTPEQRAQLYKNNRKYQETNLKGKAVFLFNSLRERCKRSGHTIGITTQIIHGALLYGRCWRTGFKFRYDRSKRGGITPFSPSVDRIDSDKGYEPDNVQMVCTIYNIGKGAHDELDFIAMCLAVAEKNKHNEAAIARMIELQDM